MRGFLVLDPHSAPPCVSAYYSCYLFSLKPKKLESIVGRRQRGHVAAPSAVLPTRHDGDGNRTLYRRECGRC